MRTIIDRAEIIAHSQCYLRCRVVEHQSSYCIAAGIIKRIFAGCCCHLCFVMDEAAYSQPCVEY